MSQKDVPEAPLFLAYHKTSEVGRCSIHKTSNEPYVLVVHPDGENQHRFCSKCEQFILGRLMNAYYRRLKKRDLRPLGFNAPVLKDEDNQEPPVDTSDIASVSV